MIAEFLYDQEIIQATMRKQRFNPSAWTRISEEIIYKNVNNEIE